MLLRLATRLRFAAMRLANCVILSKLRDNARRAVGKNSAQRLFRDSVAGLTFNLLIETLQYADGCGILLGYSQTEVANAGTKGREY